MALLKDIGSERNVFCVPIIIIGTKNTPLKLYF